jgi:hypothetical protein
MHTSACLRAVCLVGSIAIASSSYIVNPSKCSSKLASDCFLQGTVASHTQHGHEQSMKGTCVQCLIQQPGIETWGCTLGMLREYCSLGFFDGSLDIDEEEKHDPKTFKPIKVFASAHAEEMGALKKKIHTGMSDYAKLLTKFDTQNPDFTKVEQKIMQKLLYDGDSNRQIFWSDPSSFENLSRKEELTASGLTKGESKAYGIGQEGFRKTFLTSPEYSEDVEPGMGEAFKAILAARESARVKMFKAKEAS